MRSITVVLAACHTAAPAPTPVSAVPPEVAPPVTIRGRGALLDGWTDVAVVGPLAELRCVHMLEGQDILRACSEEPLPPQPQHATVSEMVLEVDEGETHGVARTYHRFSSRHACLSWAAAIHPENLDAVTQALLDQELEVAHRDADEACAHRDDEAPDHCARMRTRESFFEHEVVVRRHTHAPRCL